MLVTHAGKYFNLTTALRVCTRARVSVLGEILRPIKVLMMVLVSTFSLSPLPPFPLNPSSSSSSSSYFCLKSLHNVFPVYTFYQGRPFRLPFLDFSSDILGFKCRKKPIWSNFKNSNPKLLP